MKPKVKVTVNSTYFSEMLNSVSEIGVLNDRLHRNENPLKHTIVLNQTALVRRNTYDSETLVEIAEKNDKLFGIFNFNNFYIQDINKFVYELVREGFGFILNSYSYESGINLILNPIFKGKYTNTVSREKTKGFNKGAFATGQLAQSIRKKTTKTTVTKKYLTK